MSLGSLNRPAANPEQLFAAGYAACFEDALLRVARERKAPIRESSVTAPVVIGLGQDGFVRLCATLDVSVPGRDGAEVDAMVRIDNDEVCPYSRATRCVHGHLKTASPSPSTFDSTMLQPSRS